MVFLNQQSAARPLPKGVGPLIADFTPLGRLAIGGAKGRPKGLLCISGMGTRRRRRVAVEQVFDLL
jgi:hypothetical protein